MMSKALLLVICLCLSSVLSLPHTSSLFTGRSADIIIEYETQQDSAVFYKGEQLSSTQISQLEDTRFADLFSHIMGTQAFHVDANREGFPTSSLFSKPRASLIVAIDSVGVETLKKYSTLSLLQNTASSSISTLSSPPNTLTLLANIATGSTPSQHGIVGQSWRRPYSTGGIVTAYDNQGRSFSANIADILLQETQGLSLVVSASSSSSFSSALGAHPELVADNIGWRAHAYSLVNGAFVSRYEDPSIEQLLQLSESELAALVSDLTFNGVTFSTKTPEDFALLAELAFVKNLIAKLNTDIVLSAMVKDDMPDMYNFVFASLKAIQTKYGDNSNEFAAALALVDKSIETLFVALNGFYDNRVAAAIFALNAREGSSVSLKDKVYQKVSGLLHTEKEFDAFYPNLYVRNEDFNGYARDVLCSGLQKAIVNDKASVYCAPPLLVAKATRQVGAPAPCPTPDPKKEAEDLATVWAFWLNFFITIILISFIGWGVYCMAFVGSDASKDSLLFRATGRHHHQN